MAKYNYNGQILTTKKALNNSLPMNNRSFKYGDGLFETIRVFEGKIPFLNLHFQRLKQGMEVLSLEAPQNFTLDFLQVQIEKILPHQKSNSRVRLMVFRQGEGLYTPVSNQINFLIEISELEKSYLELNTQPLTYGIFEAIRVSTDILSNLKTNNSLPYILAGNYKKRKGLGEVLVLNTWGRICEGMASNIFIQVADNQLFTPSLEEGCVAGTMRKIILEIAPQIGIEITETKCELIILNDAQEIFTSNAIQGIQSLQTKTKETTLAKRLQKAINQKIQNF
jgi:branched-chain amino acid aminotransferase